MSALRFFAVILIYAGASVAWMVLGGTLEYRTARLNDSLSQDVNALWGPPELLQPAPCVTTVGGSAQAVGATGLLASDVRADFVHHNRCKGLLWFSTYTVDFTGRYTVSGGSGGGEGKSEFVFWLPSGAPAIEALTVTLDGQRREPGPVEGASNALKVPLPDGAAEHAVTIAFKTRGRDRWLYLPHPPGAAQAMVRDLRLTVTTNFPDIDYPLGSVSPVEPARIEDRSASAGWRCDRVLMGQPMGVEMPARENAGPVAARMSFFAPVSLLFFFTVMFTVVVLKRIALHPMHYLFLSAGFFAFHILLAYLVDIVNIHLAFWICAAVSVLLVVTYMRLVAGMRFALAYVGLAQLVYLVGFSCAFFWRGRTGLAVTAGAIVTLFVLMQATGRVDWNAVFGRPGPPALPPLPPIPPDGARTGGESEVPC